MRILVLGAYGLIGSAVTARLLSTGHQVTGIGRRISDAVLRFPSVHWVECDIGKMTRLQHWQPLLAEADAVVNCVGALQDNSQDDLLAVHFEGPRALVQAAMRARIRYFIQISAAGVTSTSGTFFFRSKSNIDDLLIELEWGLILRPGLVLAPQAFGGSALLRGLAGFPLAVPVLNPKETLQYVIVNDIAETVVRALQQDAPQHGCFDLVYPEKLAIADLLRRIRSWLGIPPAPLLEIPDFFARQVGRCADFLDRLGWRSPLHTTAINQFREGVSGDGERWQAVFKIEPHSVDDFLRENPASVQERWFSRLYFLKPTLLICLSLFWLLSGVIALIQGESAAAVLVSAGWEQSFAYKIVIATSCLDTALGLMVLVRRSAALALLMMIVVSLSYLLVGTTMRPDLWLDPLGPFLKVVPQIILALVGLAVLENR